jgi:hypothetical protein
VTAPAARVGPASRESALLVACARTRPDAETAARVRALVAAGVDWGVVVRRAAPHGMLPLLARHVLALDAGALPDAVRADLRARVKRIAHDNLGRAGELARLMRALESAGIPAAAFKGVTLAVTAYDDLALRSFVDMDVLVPRRHLDAASAVLAACGYAPAQGTALTAVQRAVFLRFIHALAFVHPGSRATVDLHWEVQLPMLAVAFDTDRLLGRAVPVRIGRGAVATLAPADLLLVLCAHGSKHCWERLAWICDVAELVGRHPALDWPAVLEAARGLGIRRMLDLGLFLAGELLGAPVPPPLHRQAAADPAVRRLAARVGRGLDREPAGHPGDLDGLAFVAAARERLRDRGRLVLRSVTTPTGSEVAAVALPAPLAFLYYPLRPVRLAVRHARRLLGRTPRPATGGRT